MRSETGLTPSRGRRPAAPEGVRDRGRRKTALREENNRQARKKVRGGLTRRVHRRPITINTPSSLDARAAIRPLSECDLSS